MKIVIDNAIPFLERVLDPWAEVVRLPGDAIGPRDVRDADALLVRTRTRCDGALLNGSSVRFIGTATVGADHIDTAWCAAHGIAVATAAGSNSHGVLQWVAAALAWLAGVSDRRSPSMLEMDAPKEGGGIDFPAHTTLGIVGVGHVGGLVSTYARDWGFRVMCSDPPRERAEGLGVGDGFFPFGEIAARCDVITFHVPLTAGGVDATRGMVDREFLAATRPGAVILNSSRGPVIDSAALSGAARGQQNIPFIIDTWNNEPAIDRAVLERVLIATPHIAGYSIQGKASATAMVVNALSEYFSLPLTGWYPPGAPRSHPRPIGWDEMCRRMPSHFDIAAESAALRSHPEEFERMRNDYAYRREFF
jgi:erythronate-4-phosphate dehydrogenase